MKPCPMCLFSSGFLADGKGTVCPDCGGIGVVSNKKFSELITGTINEDDIKWAKRIINERENESKPSQH